MENREGNKDALIIFGQNIQKARKKQNLDISELASRAGYDRICLSRLECGEHNVTYETAVKLAKALDTSFPALFSRNYLTETAGTFCEDDFLLVFTENIERELRAKGMMQVHIYIDSGIQEAVVSRILNGKVKNPTLQTLYKIASGTTDGDMARLFSRVVRD